MIVKLNHYIDGSWVDSAETLDMPMTDPATEEVLATLPVGSGLHVDNAVSAAARATKEWTSLSLDERLEILESAIEAVNRESDAIARVEQSEMGRPASVGRPWIEGAVSSFREALDVARNYPFIRKDSSNTVIARRPVGPVALITPWNFPTNVILGALCPLLASGNTVVLKPSEKASLSAARLIELLDLPPGVVNMVLGDGSTGDLLSSHPAVGLTHFTGSVAAGRSIALANAKNLRRVVLELGGKDPAIVDRGVNVPAVARDVARGAFLNTGQICTSIERIYVHQDVAEAFIAALTTEAEHYRYRSHTPDTAIGPLVDARQREIVTAHVDEALERGATATTGGIVPEGVGYFYPATVLVGVTDDMAVMREETFGPIAPVQVVDSFDVALEKANSTDFGLAATVYSAETKHIDAARDLAAGVVWVNGWQGAGHHVIFEPFGQSGMSATGHVAAFDAATRPSAVVHSPLR